MNLVQKKPKALGLCSGGLDSILAGVVLRSQEIEVIWVSFETPFFNADKARAASDRTGIPLITRDITDRYLPMFADPPAGYGQCMNPCMDCHALMFRIAGEIMGEIKADFLFSGEVLGQRPMSQVRSSLRYVEKRSGFDGYILRPLSAKKLPVTWMEEKGLVDRGRLLDFSGRSRKPQMALAQSFGITDYPAPAGGCLLTDPGFSGRLKDLFLHESNLPRRELELLKYGRHMRLAPEAKLIVGRNKDENEKIMSFFDSGEDTLIRLRAIAGPVGLIPRAYSPSVVEQAAGICAGYSKAPRDKTVEAEIRPPGRSAEVVPVIPINPKQASGLIIKSCK
ncbi:MAG: tRNA 4-thiouridine(8) synthase ThiI [Desulfobacteraceae bacterium]|nr:tRNA 4-thiouridine(8) synthase ThiI [Desulfobacteraceae bacterium]